MILARSLLDCINPIFLVASRDRWSQEQLACYGYDHYCGALENAWSLLPHPAGILIDTRLTQGLDLWMAAARDRRVPVASIHDLGLNPLHSDIYIDGSIVPLIEKADFPGTAFFLGTEFLILDPAYGSLNHRKKKIREEIRSIYINMGGGNSQKFYYKLLEGLKLWARKAEIIGIPGFVSWGQVRVAQMDWHPLNFRWEYDSVDTVLSQADLAITAGGLAAYEALCAGIPLLALSYDSLQQKTISAIAGRGGCIDLGRGDDLDPVRLSRIIAEVDADRNKRRELSALGRKLVDGLGAERVTRIIRQWILGHSAAGRKEFLE
jgi:hypothetical protein